MDIHLFETLLYQHESETLDFKKEQYKFSGATDEEKGELLKDILAFANSYRKSNAYILIGVEEVRPGPCKVHHIPNHLDDHQLQQFVNSRTQRLVEFSYEVFEYQGKNVGIIQIRVQQRPLFLKKSFGKLFAQAVYVRHGSSTAIADPDEISLMGFVRNDEASREIELREVLRELNYFNETYSKIDLQKRSVSFPTDLYLRLIDKGILHFLPEELNAKLRDVYSEIRISNQMVAIAWSAPRGTQVWKECIAEAQRRYFEACQKAILVMDDIRQILTR